MQPDIHTLNRLLAEAELDNAKETDMKLKDMYPSTLLKSEDVTDAGGEMPVTIKSIDMKTFEGEGTKETKPIMVFTNDHQMVVNKTNANALAEMFGDDTEAWIGKEITLIVAQVDFQGKQVPAIRIKNMNSKEAAIQAYWAKTREMGFTRQDGLDHLKLFNGDFVAALKGLDAPA